MTGDRPVRKGRPWGRAAGAPADVEIAGGDPELARSVTPGSDALLVAWRPGAGADLARAVGLAPEGDRTTELAVDALSVRADDAPERVAVNAVVLGRPPDRLGRLARRHHLEVTVDDRAVWSGRATTVVVANGQFVRAADLAPRGHPGDGRAEIQVYALGPGERAGMRRRLGTGTHVPHPAITERTGRVVGVVARSPLPLEADGVAWGRARTLEVSVLPGALRILV